MLAGFCFARCVERVFKQFDIMARPKCGDKRSAILTAATLAFAERGDLQGRRRDRKHAVHLLAHQG